MIRPSIDQAQALMLRWGKWVQARRWSVLSVSLVIAVAATVITARLPVLGDFSYLLPPSEQSVRQLRALEARTRVPATFMVGVESDVGAERQRATHLLCARLQAIEPTLVASVTCDKGVARRFAWEHRFLFASLDDLTAAQEDLNQKILQATGLYEPLDEDSDDAPHAKLDRLEKRLDDARAEQQKPADMVSDDGRLALILVRTPFTSDDLDRGRGALSRIQAAMHEVHAEVGSSVTFGMTGDVVTTLAEHSSLLSGILWSTAVTVALCLVALLGYYRTLLGVLSMFWALTVGTVITFAVTKLTIGHLNLASAFLSSIVVGNGVNFGIVLLARYLEERRSGTPLDQAVPVAMAATMPGTLAASLAAAVAYASLAVTPFRGFRDFGIIAGTGMLLCWLSTYSVLPAALCALGPRFHISREPALGRVLDAIMPRRSGPVAIAALALLGLFGAASYHFLTHDPLEVNLRNVRSYTPELTEASRWMTKFDTAFGHGISGGFVIGVPNRQDAPQVAARLRQVDAGKPVEQHLLSQISTLDDLLPTDQPAKLALLPDIRRKMRHLSEADRKKFADVVPPEHLTPVTDADVPEDLAWPYTERDGTRGRVVLINTGLGVDLWNVHDIGRFVGEVRGLALGKDVLIGGAAFVFSDMLTAVQREAPRATLTALVAAALVVVLLVGAGRFGAITLLCGALGTLAMVALGWQLGLKVNFINFMALPITIGIGIDYSANIVARARQEGAQGGRRALRTTGGAVVLCSYTTVVAYASLFFSPNRGIQSFGLAALLGELTCLTAALLVAPALLDFHLAAPERPRRAPSDVRAG